MKRFLLITAGLLMCASMAWAAPATRPSAQRVGEQVPSEDPLLKDFHSLGLIQGRVNIFRCASAVRDLGTPTTSPSDAAEQLDEATARMRHLYDLGIRTIVCLEDPDRPDESGGKAKTLQLKTRIALEKEAAEKVGIAFHMHPMANAGKDSLEDMTDAQVMAWLEEASKDVLDSSAQGGVAFHCSAGHDRTGMVTAYIRMKYEHWPVDQAIDEMRRLGHNWAKYSTNGGQSSWHEAHLRAIAVMLDAAPPK